MCESKGDWIEELLGVPWLYGLQRCNWGTPFHLIYGTEAVTPTKVSIKFTICHFDNNGNNEGF